MVCANNTNYQDVEINRSVDNNLEEFIPVKYLRKPDDNNPICPKTVPGNSSYLYLTKSGKKICILSDSICKGINMRELNYYINKGYAYRKTFEGAKSHELAHYCILTLLNDKPDIVIINIDLNNLESINIIGNIVNIIDICKSYGVNKVYVAGLTYRENHQKKVCEVNDFLRHWQFTNDFKYIDNDKIGKVHLWNDRIHLNKSGTIILANNFIGALNNKALYDMIYPLSSSPQIVELSTPPT